MGGTQIYYISQKYVGRSVSLSLSLSPSKFDPKYLLKIWQENVDLGKQIFTLNISCIVGTEKHLQ